MKGSPTSTRQVLLGAFAAALALAVVAPAVCSERLIIGVLKGDSLVVPVFTYSDKKWNAIGVRTAMDSLRERPWYGYMSEPCYGLLTHGAGEVPVRFHTNGKVQSPDGGYGVKVVSDIPCAVLEGLCSDKVVTSPIAVPVLPLSDLRDDTYRWNYFLNLVLPTFDRFETEELGRLQPGGPEREGWPASLEDRRKRTPVFQALLQTEGFLFYRLERTYPWLEEQHCYRRTVVEGWIQGDFTTGASESPEHRVTLSECDGKQLKNLRPMGSITLDGHHYLIGTLDGYEWWQEVVIELGDTPRVIAQGYGRGW